MVRPTLLSQCQWPTCLNGRNSYTKHRRVYMYHVVLDKKTCINVRFPVMGWMCMESVLQVHVGGSYRCRPLHKTCWFSTLAVRVHPHAPDQGLSIGHQYLILWFSFIFPSEVGSISKKKKKNPKKKKKNSIFLLYRWPKQSC